MTKSETFDFKLGKPYKLCSKTEIDSLFNDGQIIKSYPFICHFKVTKFDSTIPFQLVISAPKRTFRKAVQRNRIKRISKEAIRKTKNTLEAYLKENKTQLSLFIVYTAKEEVDHITLEKKADKLFQKIIKTIPNEDI